MFCGDVSTYQPPLSLWRLVEQSVSPEQQEEIRSMLGTSLIETTLDLHNEVETLLEIWREYQHETEAEAEQARSHTLAEPPHVRERLVKEICFLAEGIREKSMRKGMSPSDLLSGHNVHILDYAEEAQRSGSSLSSHRPMSAMSTDGRCTPVSPSHVARSRHELCDVIEDDVTAARDKLNYMQFDQVCSKLRSTLRKEVEQLEEDVVFLHSCLDMASDARGHAASPALSREPTLTELREERSLLEKALLSSDSLPRAPPPNTASRPPLLTKTHATSGLLQNLAPMKGKLKPAGAPASTTHSGKDRGPAVKASGPMKACHPAPHMAPHSSSPDHPSTSSSPDSSTRTISPDTLSLPRNSSPLGRESPLARDSSSASVSANRSAGTASPVSRTTKTGSVPGARSVTTPKNALEAGGGASIRPFEAGTNETVNRTTAEVYQDLTRLERVTATTSVAASAASSNPEEAVQTRSSRPSPLREGSRGSGGGGGEGGGFGDGGVGGVPPATRDGNNSSTTSIRIRDGSGSRHRTMSPARVKVVPVGSLIPTPPPPSAEKPQFPRPSSADRFRKMVMHSRETT